MSEPNSDNHFTGIVPNFTRYDIIADHITHAPLFVLPFTDSSTIGNQLLCNTIRKVKSFILHLWHSLRIMSHLAHFMLSFIKPDLILLDTITTFSS